MISVHLRITLLTDASFQATSATVGPVETLPRVPGAALLGAAAKRLYAAVGADAWNLFHSGRVRFGDGLPEDGGEPAGPALPMPLSLHVEKGKRARRGASDEFYFTSNILNFAQYGILDRALADPLREGFVGAGLRWIDPARRVSMRTAIGEGGRAREGLLYHISALQAGTVFLARIDLNDAMAHRAPDLVCAFDRAELELGRSRSAELGRARAEVIVAPTDALRVHGDLGTERIILWALSDLALRDRASGSPSLMPTAEAFGMPSRAVWNPDFSFLRARAYSPYNSKRAANDLSRQVIAAGSVIAFDLPGGLSAPERAALLDRLARGVGQHRAEGLGQLLANPSLLMAQKPGDVNAWADAEEREEQVRGPSNPPGELGAWLLHRGTEDRVSERALRLSGDWAKRLVGMPNISPAQWRRLGGAARRMSTLPALRDHLFGPTNPETTAARGILRDGVTGHRWGARAGGREAWRWLKDLIEQDAERMALETEHEAVLVRAVALLADHMARPHQEQA